MALFLLGLFCILHTQSCNPNYIFYPQYLSSHNFLSKRPMRWSAQFNEQTTGLEALPSYTFSDNNRGQVGRISWIIPVVRTHNLK